LTTAVEGRRKKEKTMSVDDGSLGQEKKKTKTLSVDDGSLGRKGKKKKEVLSVEVPKPRSGLGFQDFDAQTHRQTT
jgi:hypothetical protein